MNGAEKYNISDNINLYVINDKKYKTVHYSFFLHRKLKKEEVTLNSLLSKVLKSGTKNHPTVSSLSKYAESLFGCGYDVFVTKRANVQSIVSSVNIVSDRFTNENSEKKALELMLDLVFNPNVSDSAFSDEVLNLQKTNLKDDIESLINDKRSYATVRCLEHMCDGEPNAIVEIGYKEDIDKIDSNILFNHYKSIIISSPIDIFAVGDVDADSLVSQIKEYIKKYTFNIVDIEVEHFSKTSDAVKNITETLDVNQGKLVLGLRTGINIEHSAYYALLTANSIFGSGAHSKLFNNVREALSLCYYAYSRLDKYNSLMLVGSGIESKNFELAKNAILTELDNVKNGNFTDDELNVAKEYIISSYNSYKDSPSMLIDYYMGKVFCPSLPSLDQACDKVSKVTKQELIDAFSTVTLDTVYFLTGKEAK